MLNKTSNNTTANTANYILNIDWLTISGSQHMNLARELLRPQKSLENTKEKNAAATAQDFMGTRQITMGNLILDIQDYGTRFFSVMIHVYYGREIFGVLLICPRVGKVRDNTFQLKVHNYWLYQEDVWTRLAYVCGTIGLVPNHISRLDLAADFNKFANGMHPIEFIRQFMAGEIKKKGRSVGNVHFSQSYVAGPKGSAKEDVLKFNALTIGRRSSDACCYLYNKTLEMEEQTKKPWIIETWKAAGLDTSQVWRLEISLTTKAMHIIDKHTGESVDFGLNNLTSPGDGVDCLQLFHIYLQSLFFFFVPTGQQNVTREKMIPLFGDMIPFSRSVLRGLNPSDRAERVLIKKLHTLVDRYRGFTRDDMFTEQDYAKRLANSCGLGSWYEEKKQYWKDTKYKS